ncbi:MAG: NAD(P)-binding protein [candidate division WOR-3 bacterium]|nr:MAG: NAD(P)-binding protein [candidate division WOR-3 bacterium]
MYIPTRVIAMKGTGKDNKIADVIVLGAGLAGLSAAQRLGDASLVLEKENRPGGLVRTECFNNYWFDRVLHLLYFPDPLTKLRVQEILGTDLAQCTPLAWVETQSGTVRYPLQMHLGGLEKSSAFSCLVDLMKAKLSHSPRLSNNFEEMLLHTFGSSMCRIFLLPYNRKLWKRPLTSLAPFDFQWTISKPNLKHVFKGIIFPDSEFDAYNYQGFYPRPPMNSSVRGMELLSHKLAGQVFDLRLNHTVTKIDTKRCIVYVMNDQRMMSFRYRSNCISTIPLPETIRMCRQTPDDILRDCDKLLRNRVLSAAFSIKGPRPVNNGHWRYYADESIIFTRLFFMHEFDPLTAPEDGWGVCAEIVQPAEVPMMEPKGILNRALNDIHRSGVLPPTCEVVDQHLIIIDPGYVVFTKENKDIITRMRDFLADHGVIPLGRYGRWEYSSMGQVMRDAYTAASRVAVTSSAFENNSSVGNESPGIEF